MNAPRHIVLSVVLCFVLFVGAIMLVVFIGALVEGIAQIEHERCLKKATNGYEIKRCR